MKQRNTQNAPAKAGAALSIDVDFKRYAHFLEELDIPEDKKREMLQSYWEIICSFVHLGFGVTSSDFMGRLTESFQKVRDEASQKLALPKATMVSCKDQASTKPESQDAAPCDAFSEGVTL